MVIRQYNNFSVKRSRSKRQTNRQKGNSVPSCVMKPLPLALPSRENPTCLMSAASVGVCHHSHITSITTITTSQLHSSSECRVLFSLLIFICISRCCCCQFAYWWAHLVCPVRKEFIFSFSLSLSGNSQSHSFKFSHLCRCNDGSHILPMMKRLLHQHTSGNEAFQKSYRKERGGREKKLQK